MLEDESSTIPRNERVLCHVTLQLQPCTLPSNELLLTEVQYTVSFPSERQHEHATIHLVISVESHEGSEHAHVNRQVLQVQPVWKQERRGNSVLIINSLTYSETSLQLHQTRHYSQM